MDCVIKQSIQQFHEKFFRILKCLACNAEKTEFKIKKNNEHSYLYKYMLYVTRMTQNEHDSINSILQYGPVVGKNCCVVFLASGFQYLVLCPRHCKGKVATTYLVTRTKSKNKKKICYC